MSNIKELDKNFAEKAVVENGSVYYNVFSFPFKLYGNDKQSEPHFYRMPDLVAKNVSGPLDWLSKNTAGIRIRFKTDSPYVIVKSERYPLVMGHMPSCGSCGFDVYKDTYYAGTVMPSDKQADNVYTFDRHIEGQIGVGEGLKDITVNFPLYCTVNSVTIGLKEGSTVEAPTPYKYEKPVVYYGSSITQGGCASRPGNSYQAVISRKLDCDHINLGFSGNAKGEKAMAEYIASLDMSCFVMDYDYNSNEEGLKETHRPFYDIIRKAHPNLPIIIVTSPRARKINDTYSRRAATIKETYDYAKAKGDKVWFIEGTDICNYADSEMMTVDGTHPNDFGFWCMAEVIGKAVKEALESK